MVLFFPVLVHDQTERIHGIHALHQALFVAEQTEVRRLRRVVHGQALQVALSNICSPLNTLQEDRFASDVDVTLVRGIQTRDSEEVPLSDVVAEAILQADVLEGSEHDHLSHVLELVHLVYDPYVLLVFTRNAGGSIQTRDVLVNKGDVMIDVNFELLDVAFLGNCCRVVLLFLFWKEAIAENFGLRVVLAYIQLGEGNADDEFQE